MKLALQIIHDEIDDMDHRENHNLSKPNNGDGEIIDVELEDEEVGPLEVQKLHEGEQQGLELRRGEARAGGDASGGNEASGKDTLNANGPPKTIASQGQPQ